jgi:hypothetical protein
MSKDNRKLQLLDELYKNVEDCKNVSAKLDPYSQSSFKKNNLNNLQLGLFSKAKRKINVSIYNRADSKSINLAI